MVIRVGFLYLGVAVIVVINIAGGNGVEDFKYQLSFASTNTHSRSDVIANHIREKWYVLFLFFVFLYRILFHLLAIWIYLAFHFLAVKYGFNWFHVFVLVVIGYRSHSGVDIALDSGSKGRGFESHCDRSAFSYFSNLWEKP